MGKGTVDILEAHCWTRRTQEDAVLAWGTAEVPETHCRAGKAKVL